MRAVWEEWPGGGERELARADEAARRLDPFDAAVGAAADAP